MKIFLRLFILFSLGWMILSWYRIITTTAPDFTVFYGTARLMEMQATIYGSTSLFTAFNYPPTTVLLIAPFTIFPLPFAQGLWITISFFLIPVCVWLSLLLLKEGKVGIERIGVWSCIWFWSFPTKFTLGMGQVNLISLFFLLLGMNLLIQKRFKWAAVFFTVLIISKPQTALVLPFLMLAGYGQTALWSIGAYVVLSIGTGIVFGGNYFRDYLNIQMPEFLKFSGREIYYNQAVSGFFSRIASIPLAQRLSQTTTVFLLGGLGVLSSFVPQSGTTADKGRGKQYFLIQLLSIFLCIFLMVEPLGWQHHFVFILPVYLWLWYQNISHKTKVLLIVSFILISWNIKTPGNYSGILHQIVTLSHVFWGNLLLLFIGLKLVVWENNSHGNSPRSMSE